MIADRPPPNRHPHRWNFLAVLLTSSCAFEPGEPIGRLSPSLSVALDLGDGRVADGRWLTSTDYAIELTAFEVEVVSLSIGLSGGEVGEIATFDPANPPPGYSNCHGGHCHAADGSLPTYEDIEAELARGGLEPDRSLTVPVEGGSVSLEIDGAPVSVAFGDCPERCAVTASRLVSAIVGVDQVRIAGVVYDRRVGDGARLPVEGVPFVFDVDVEATVQAPLSGIFGEDESALAVVTATLNIGGTLFDGVDFAALAASEGVDGVTASALTSLSGGLATSKLSVVVTRP